MDQYWVNQKNKELQAWRNQKYAELKEYIIKSRVLTEQDRKELLKYVDGLHGSDCQVFALYLEFSAHKFHKDSDEYRRQFYEYFNYCHTGCPDYSRYLDKSKEFDGDIIITDPCYLDDGLNDAYSFDMWNLESVGIQNYMMRDTIYGDWICRLYDVTNGKISEDSPILGRFCADAGLVAVADMDGIRKFNPDLESKARGSDWATIVYDFKGVVTFEVREKLSGFEVNGKPYADYYVIVCGDGINKKTGERIKFESY